MAMKRILSHMAAGIIGLWLAALVVPGVIVRAYPTSGFFGFSLTQQWQIFLVLGIVLGLLNFFLKPLLKALSLPLEIITLGLFTIVINGFILWLLDMMFDELSIAIYLPLLYSTLIIWGSTIILNFFLVRK